MTGCGFNAIREGRWGGVVPDSETGMIGGVGGAGTGIAECLV